MWSLLFLLLPLAAFTGWFIGRKKYKFLKRQAQQNFPSGYLLGLNYLINEQPDKAVDVFIKILDLDSETAEAHLALGSLFRRRGEVDRAIRIHQNLIARPQLDKQQRVQGLFELGQDYMRAGLLDRAERIFSELVEGGDALVFSLQYLQDIYQQQKDWEQAINVTQKLGLASGKSQQQVIAHYHCELAHNMLAKGWLEEAHRYLKRALVSDKNCVRASLILGNLAFEAKQYKTAISYYKSIKNQNSNYINEIISPLGTCFKQIGDKKGWVEFLQECLTQHVNSALIVALADSVREQQGDVAAIKLITQYLLDSPSLPGLSKLAALYGENASYSAKAPMEILHQVLTKLQTNKFAYHCSQCGFESHALYWLCPGCKRWGTISPS